MLAREFAKQGKEVTIITARVDPTSKEFEEVEGVHIYRLPCIKLPRLEIALNFPWLNYTFTTGNLGRIKGIVKRHKPDILHLHNHMFDLALSAVSARRMFKIPLVITIHTMIKHSQSFYNLFLYPADRIFLRNMIIRKADLIISPDYNILDYVRRGFGTDRNVVVLYGVDIPDPPLEEKVEQLREKFHLDKRRVILSIGHVHKIRDRKDLVEAMPLILEKVPNAVLLIVGAVTTDIPVKLAKKLGIEDKVIFAGPVPHGEIKAFLSLADIEAHWLNQDSPDKTSLGIASLESMGAGKVVMAVANEGTYGPDVLKNEENVLLVESGNPQNLAEKIVSVLCDPRRCKEIEHKARQTIEKHFGWKNIIAQTLGVYQKAKLASPWY
jgi:glycosyltransferase involved in cell wall biosynthesis